MGLLQGAEGQAWSVPAVHDTVAAIARHAEFERSVGQSAMQRIMQTIGKAMQAMFEFFRGSETGRHVTLVIVVLIVMAIAVHFILAALAERNDVVAADANPARTRAADAWREAQRLAAAGRHTEASHALLAALLSSFAQRGEVRLHASKTAGDYARELGRRGSAARGPFQQFRRRYDAVIFGAGTCDASEYADLLRDAEPLLSRGGIA